MIPMIDYMSFSVEVQGYSEKIQEYAESLERMKLLAKEYSTNKSNDKALITIGDKTFEVLANGANGYAYILHSSEYEVKLAQFRSKNPQFYPVKIRVYAESLWSKGPEVAFQEIYEWVAATFGAIIDNKVSRLDLCCHTDELEISYATIGGFKGLFRQKNIREFNRTVSGVEFGSRGGKIYGRIYNKSLEIQQKRVKLWFYDIWKDKGLEREPVWNVEFELRREFFTDYKINSVEDAFAHLRSIWKRCTGEWVVLTDNDRSRIENSTVSAVWEAISASFDQYVSKPLIKREKQLSVDADALIPATVGNITTVAARLGENNIKAALAIIQEKGEKYLKRKAATYTEKIDEKISLLSSDRQNRKG